MCIISMKGGDRQSAAVSSPTADVGGGEGCEVPRTHLFEDRLICIPLKTTVDAVHLRIPRRVLES